jgi:hypothetical protein
MTDKVSLIADRFHLRNGKAVRVGEPFECDAPEAKDMIAMNYAHRPKNQPPRSTSEYDRRDMQAETSRDMQTETARPVQADSAAAEPAQSEEEKLPADAEVTRRRGRYSKKAAH